MKLRGPARDLVVGNTRLRVRRTALLGAERVAGLGGRDLEGVIGQLLGTIYGRHLDPAAADRRSAALIAVTAARRELLRAVLAVHRGPAQDVVGPLLSPYDVADVLTLLRGAAHDLPDDDVLDAVDAVGALTPAVARHVVADDPEVVVPRLVAARLPDQDTARVLPAAWERYLRHGDLAELELTVAREAAHAQDRRLADVGPLAQPVRRHLAAGRDATNVLTALRLRGDVPMTQASLLPPGELDERALLALAVDGRPGPSLPAAWRARLERRPDPADLPALAQELQELRLTTAVARYRSGDPLGADIAVGYVAAVETEARALRQLLTTAPCAPGTTGRAA